MRHVRSLTYNPWIRWGTIEDEAGDEEGLIIGDLVEGDPNKLDEDDVVERMIAVLGARRTAERVGESRVRAILGSGADFTDHIGEPLLLGTILNETATTTAIQVQVLRPRIDPTELEAFESEAKARTGANLSSIEQQRAAVRGLEHFIRLERGLAITTPDHARLVAWIESLPIGERRRDLRLMLDDPRQNFMRDEDGNVVRKFFEYDATPDGYVDRTNPAEPITASDDFTPVPRVPYDFRVAGVPLFERNFEEVGLADAKYVPIMFVVIAVVLLFVFRGVTGIVVPLVVVFASILAMIGTAFAVGDLLNNLTMMSPNMLTAVGIADAIHLVAAWSLLRHRYDNKRDLIVEVIRRNALPVFLTSVTTAIGFYSLTVSRLEPVQKLGWMAALGTFFAWAFSMTLIPALLSIVPHRGVSSKKPAWVARLFTEARAARFVDTILRRRRVIVGASAVLFLVAGFGLSRVLIDSDFRSMFPRTNKTMANFDWIETRMGGIGDLEIVFAGIKRGSSVELTAEETRRREELRLRTEGRRRHPDDFAAPTSEEARELAALDARHATWNDSRIGVSPRFLAVADRFERRLRTEAADPNSVLAVVTDFISPLDTLRKIHQVQNENIAAFYRTPTEADVAPELREGRLDYDEWTEEWSWTPAQGGATLCAQYYLQYESGARPGEGLSTQLSADRTQFRMQARLAQASSAGHLRAFERIEEIARNEFPELVTEVDDSLPAAVLAEMTLSGKNHLFARTSDLFARGFVESMTLALAVITVLIGLIFRSVRLALVSMIPNILPIILPLSVFGLLRRPLDGPAILVSSIALGVCVDDTIHFLTKFVRGRRRGLSPRDALVSLFVEAGSALTLTTVVLIIGFSTLLLSDFAPNFQMGMLASIMIASAWVADFVVTAAVLSYVPGADVDMDTTNKEPSAA